MPTAFSTLSFDPLMVILRGDVDWSMSTLAEEVSWMCFTVHPRRPMSRATKRGSQYKTWIVSDPSGDVVGDEGDDREDGLLVVVFFVVVLVAVVEVVMIAAVVAATVVEVAAVGLGRGLATAAAAAVFFSFSNLSFLAPFSSFPLPSMTSLMILMAWSTELFLPLTYIILLSQLSIESWSIQTLQPVRSMTSLTRDPDLPITQPTTEGDKEHVTSVLAFMLTVETSCRRGNLGSCESLWLLLLLVLVETAPSLVALGTAFWLCFTLRCCSVLLSACILGSSPSPLSLLTAFFAIFLMAALPGTPLRP
mmetsp:Transcript_29060/g.54852  ORF Transcript_29060/g.54852 Transcript_29060/m.54852 type:complete len:307 (-) Transcript_29060:180-1100(-)